MKLRENLPPRHDALPFSISGTGSFVCPVAQIWLDIPRPLITQSHRHGWTYQGLYLPSHTDTAGHTKAFDYPVTQTRLDIPRPLITQSHRHGWTYQGLNHVLPQPGGGGVERRPPTITGITVKRCKFTHREHCVTYAYLTKTPMNQKHTTVLLAKGLISSPRSVQCTTQCIISIRTQESQSCNRMDDWK